jgi:hypothetical protein
MSISQSGLRSARSPRSAHSEIQTIKAAVLAVLEWVVDKAIQTHGVPVPASGRNAEPLLLAGRADRPAINNQAAELKLLRRRGFSAVEALTAKRAEDRNPEAHG